MPKAVLGGVITAVGGVVGFLIVNGVTAGADSSSWSTTEITIVSLLGTILLAVVIINMLGGLS